MENLLRDRKWMYNMRVYGESYNNDEFMDGVRGFIQTAISRGQLSENMLLRCACSKCKNKKFLGYLVVEEHLYKYGFLPNYYNWTLHGEDLVARTYIDGDLQFEVPSNAYSPFTETANEGSHSRLPQMLADLAGPNLMDEEFDGIYNELPNPDANRLYDLLKSSSEPAYLGCTTETELSINMKLLATKSNFGFSESAFNSICDTMHSLVGTENRIPTSFIQSKRLVSDLGMGYKRIDVCINGCMIYYGADESLLLCRLCRQPRYHPPRRVESSSNYKRNGRSQMFYLPIIPRLQCLFMTESVASQMSWHASPRDDDSRMVHPADGESWKHFDSCYPSFASETRNIRLGLCSDGFSPWGMSSKQYSIWPIMITPYNLPPWMCMKKRFLWLTVLIPGPSNPKKRLDIYLRPLLDDLVHLWNVGVETYDASRKQNFMLRAALMWTISDFPAYGMLSGWSTQGKLGCPYCMDDTKTFFLSNGRKVSYFDCHRRFLPPGHPFRTNRRGFYKDRVEHDSSIPFHSGHEIHENVRNLKYVWEQDIDEVFEGYGVHHNWTKKSIFWELPYWPDVKLRHNLDVMHIEKNIFENLFNTIMDVKGKTKDNGVNCRKDIALYCRRPELQLKLVRGRMVAKKAKYQLSTEQQIDVLNWIQTLKFPDGFSANLGRHVDYNHRKLVGYKTHDAHVFLGKVDAHCF